MMDFFSANGDYVKSLNSSYLNNAINSEFEIKHTSTFSQ
jgi:hypothetical protein